MPIIAINKKPEDAIFLEFAVAAHTNAKEFRRGQVALCSVSRPTEASTSRTIQFDRQPIAGGGLRSANNVEDTIGLSGIDAAPGNRRLDRLLARYACDLRWTS